MDKLCTLGGALRKDGEKGEDKVERDENFFHN